MFISEIAILKYEKEQNHFYTEAEKNPTNREISLSLNHRTKEERDILLKRAHELKAKSYSWLQIAERLGVNYYTLKVMMAREKRRTNEQRYPYISSGRSSQPPVTELDTEHIVGEVYLGQ